MVGSSASFLYQFGESTFLLSRCWFPLSVRGQAPPANSGDLHYQPPGRRISHYLSRPSTSSASHLRHSAHDPIPGCWWPATRPRNRWLPARGPTKSWCHCLVCWYLAAPYLAETVPTPEM